MSLTVSELATESGMTVHAVRYYSCMGLLSFRRDPDNGYRLYKTTEVSWLRFIYKAKKLGFTLSEIREIKHDVDNGEVPCHRVRDILQNRIVENRQQLNELERLQTRMEMALEMWSHAPDDSPDSDSVCHLIEIYSPDDHQDICHFHDQKTITQTM